MNFLEQNYLPDLQAILSLNTCRSALFSGHAQQLFGSAFSVQPILTRPPGFARTIAPKISRISISSARDAPRRGLPASSSSIIVEELIGGVGQATHSGSQSKWRRDELTAATPTAGKRLCSMGVYGARFTS